MHFKTLFKTLKNRLLFIAWFAASMDMVLDLNPWHNKKALAI